MKNRTTAITLTIVTVLCCGCPGLSSCLMFFYSFAMTGQQAFAASGMPATPGMDLNAAMWVTRIMFLLGGLVLIAIPLVVGFVTLRRSAQQSGQ